MAAVVAALPNTEKTEMHGSGMSGPVVVAHNEASNDSQPESAAAVPLGELKVAASAGGDQSDQAHELVNQVERLKERIDQLEREQDTIKEAAKHDHGDSKGLLLNLPAENPPAAGTSNIPQDGIGHERHPVHSARGLSLSGGITVIAQGSANNRAEFGGNGAETAYSTDLYMEGPIGEHGAFLLRFDVQQGAGLTRLPPVFTNADGNTNGTNNDLESYTNPESLNINEARIEQRWLQDSLTFTIGQIDLTSYFDQNNFANKETIQYITQQFNNNPTIDWGGSGNFFGGGAVIDARMTNNVTASLLLFEGNGNYINYFDNPWIGAQVAIGSHLWEGRGGNYRIYGWKRNTPHCMNASAPEMLLNCDLIPVADQVQIKDSNQGAGMSFDQEISDSLGVWGRLGYQDKDVSQFDKALQFGVVRTHIFAGRPKDSLALGYGATFPSDRYKNATGFSKTEQYLEVYYKYVLSGDGSTTGFHLSPDLQVVANPGGNDNIDPTFVYGVRLQSHF